MARFAGLLGIVVFLGIAYIFSTNRRAIKLKTVLWGIGLQFVFALLVFRLDLGAKTMHAMGGAITTFLGYSTAGAQFLFSGLGVPPTQPNSMGFFFAFQVLPTIIFISAFFALMYHLGIMQLIVRGMAWVMSRFMSISGAESLNVAASIFMGQTEAPLTIRPFLPEFTRSELMTIMTAGMAHVSGGIMALYIGVGIKAEHLLAAVIMTAPGTILMAKMLVPETEEPKTGMNVKLPEDEQRKGENFLGAIARGTIDGGKLAFNVGIMLISFLALIAAINGIMGGIHNHWGWFPDSLQTVLAWIFAPIAWLLGVPGKDVLQVGNFLGTRMVTNEAIAYTALGAHQALLDARSFTIATFALCGFANLSSIGIQIGGIGALAPNKIKELTQLGFRAMIAGTMANFLSACIVGLLMK